MLALMDCAVSIPVLEPSSCTSLDFAVRFFPYTCLHMRSLCLAFVSKDVKDGDIQKGNTRSTFLVT